MTTLDEEATCIAIKLFTLLKASGESLEINNNSEGSGLMPVHLEERSPLPAYGLVFSVAHYYIQEGDLMSDPYMEFVYNERLQTIAPILFEQHDAGIYQEVLHYDDHGNVESYISSLQKSLADFANLWMKNIEWQQNILVMNISAGS